MCLNFGTPNIINFPFVPNGKLFILGIPKLKHVRHLCHTEIHESMNINVPYFFGYKTEFFSFKNNPKNLDPSYKMDLGLRVYLGRDKLIL